MQRRFNNRENKRTITSFIFHYLGLRAGRGIGGACPKCRLGQVAQALWSLSDLVIWDSSRRIRAGSCRRGILRELRTSNYKILTTKTPRHKEQGSHDTLFVVLLLPAIVFRPCSILLGLVFREKCPRHTIRVGATR